MAASKKKSSPKKPVAKAKAKPKKPAPKAAVKAKAKAKPGKAVAKKAAPKAKAKAPAKKAPAKKAAAPAKKPAPRKAKAEATPTHGDAWGNASLKKEVDATTPVPQMTEPSGTPTLALHDHENNLVSPVEESEELAERIHGGEEAVKDADEDDDSGAEPTVERDDTDDSDNDSDA